MGYVRIRGGEPAGQECEISWKDISPDAQADRALGKLRELVEKFQTESQPYRSMLHPMFRARYGDYDHLSRVKEWSAGREDDENGSPS
jgi:ATP-dependent helicase/nuclease subunit B